MSSEYLDVMSQLHESKGMNTINFFPHCGEAANIDHLAAAFLTTHNFAHGINLRKSHMLQYMYYLADTIRQYKSTQSIGLLSYTFLRVTRKEDIVVP
nr:AMP deaminase-like [Tanacetum cinerariifolium]